MINLLVHTHTYHVLRELFAFSISECELNDDSDLNNDDDIVSIGIIENLSFMRFNY